MGSPIEMSGERDALLQLDTELKAMLESLVGQGLPDKDIRASVPAFWRIEVGGVACWESMHRTFNTVEGMPNFRKLGRYSEPFANDRLYALDGTVRCGFLTVFLFQAEVLFNELLRALGETAPNRFQESVKQLLRKLKSPDIDKKLANLKISTTLRNSLHANGIHERADLVADLDGVRFEFLEGEPVPTSWVHIAVSLRPLLAIKREALSAPETRRVVHIEAAGWAAAASLQLEQRRHLDEL